MSSSKCPNCGLANFSGALVCRHCQCPLMGDFAKAMRENLPVHKRESYRWVVLALIASLILAALLFMAFLLFTMIPNAMNSWQTGWTDYTAEEKANLTFWYFMSLGGGVAIIFLYFFLRRRKYAMGV